MKIRSLVPVIGTEQEWKIAQGTLEAASNGLYSATNELCIASLKAKSASGEMPFFFFPPLSKCSMHYVRNNNKAILKLALLLTVLAFGKYWYHMVSEPLQPSNQESKQLHYTN